MIHYLFGPLLAVWLFSGACCGALARRRNRSALGWWICGFLFPPSIVVLALEPALPPKEPTDTLTMRCAHCDELNGGIERSWGGFSCAECGRTTRFIGVASWAA